ncbi:MAG: tetratricopeptide repeat protein, partial [Acidobacteriota bacterium]
MERAKLLQSKGALGQASKLYERILPRLRTEKDRPHLADALKAMSLVATAFGEYSKAFDMAREAAAIYQELGDVIGEARSTNNAGLASFYLGQYEQALRYYHQALVLDRASGYVKGEIIRLNNIGNVDYFQSHYLAALRSYQTALKRVEENADEDWYQHERQRTLVNLAALFQKLGRYQRALDLYLELRGLPQSLSKREEARLLSNLGALYRHLGDPTKSLESYRQARRLFKLGRDHDGEIGVLRNLGIVLALDLHRESEALQVFREALALAEERSNRRKIVHGHLYLGEVFRRLGQWSQARQAYQAALREARDISTTEEEWKALFGLGKIAEVVGDGAQALDRFRQGVEVIESVRSRLRLSSLRAEFLADRRDVYDGLIGQLARRYEQSPTPPVPEEQSSRAEKKRAASGLEELFHSIERARARSFQDALANLMDQSRARSNPELWGQLKVIRARIARKQRGLLHSTADRRSQLQSELTSAEGDYLELERQLNEAAPPSVFSSVVSFSSVQAQLGENVLLLEFWLGRDQMAILWITRSGAGLARKEFQAKARTAIDNCVLRASEVNNRGWRESCASAGKYLLQGVPFETLSEIDTLVLVPDGILNSLPFEALRLPQREKLLIEAYRIFYLPSA